MICEASRESQQNDKKECEFSPVTVGLLHLGVDVEAGVAELGDLLGEQLDAVHAVAEDDALVDVQLREQRVQAVHLLLLLHERVVLGDTCK